MLEQGTGIEPAFTAWEAVVLPIYEPCENDRMRIIAKPNGKCNLFLSAHILIINLQTGLIGDIINQKEAIYGDTPKLQKY